jgi:hypothetical protein
MNKLRGLLLGGLLFSLVLPLPALAWSRMGHWLIGDLAAQHLNAAARAQVAQLLAGEGDPTLAGVASWADELRDGGDAERARATSSWHFLDSKDRSCRMVLPRDCPDGDCVVGAIEKQRALLADRRQPLATRREALKFLVHFIGDVHQPLHNSNHDDQGGNKFQVSLRTAIEPTEYSRKNYADGVMGTNLHSVWDFYILATPGLSREQYAKRLAPQVPKIRARKLGSPLSWSEESCALIDGRGLYPASHIMDGSYLAAQRALAEQRIALGAARLAAVLNDVLGRR